MRFFTGTLRSLPPFGAPALFGRFPPPDLSVPPPPPLLLSSFSLPALLLFACSPLPPPVLVFRTFPRVFPTPFLYTTVPDMVGYRVHTISVAWWVKMMGIFLVVLRSFPFSKICKKKKKLFPILRKLVLKYKVSSRKPEPKFGKLCSPRDPCIFPSSVCSCVYVLIWLVFLNLTYIFRTVIIRWAQARCGRQRGAWESYIPVIYLHQFLEQNVLFTGRLYLVVHEGGEC